MKTQFLLRALSCFLVGLYFGLSAAGAEKPRVTPPNIVVILADDVGYSDLACYGNTRIRTPNIDALARGGLRLTDYHANSSVCSPTRAALLTGRYQQRAGVETVFGMEPTEGLSPRVPTLPSFLLRAGYVTGGFGKWHLGRQAPFTPATHGFDEFIGLYTGDGDYHSRVDRSGGADWWRNEQPFVEAGYTTDLITKHSLDFIAAHRAQPFFLYVAHLAAHFPWQGPRDHADRVVGGNYDGLAKFGSNGDKKATFRMMVEALDDSVGQIVAKLRELNLTKDTLIVFASDNGGYSVEHGGYVNVSSNLPWRGQKGEVFEGGHRVPGIFHWPGHITPSVNDATVMSMDLLPTCLELAGLPLPGASEATDGVSLCGLILRQEALPERTLFWRRGETRAVRQGPWKLVMNGKTPPQLFNLSTDQGETNDRAASEAQRVSALRAAFATWEADVDTSARHLAAAKPTP